MTFPFSAVQAVLISVLSYLLWRSIRPFVVKTSLSNVPGPPRSSWWKGNYYEIFNIQGWQFHHDIVKKHGGVVKLSGLFGEELLYVSDPLALYHVVVKDQYVYEETSEFRVSNLVAFGPSLISTLGDQHRQQRKLLNPVFSPKHMRDLIHIFYPIAHQMQNIMMGKVKSGQEEINVMEWVSRAALENIGQGGLGYSFDALDENTTNSYNQAVKMLNPVAFKLKLTRQFMPFLLKLASPAFRRKLVEWAPWKNLQEAKRIIDIMDAQSREIYAKKKEALERGDEEVVKQVGQGKDIMSVLLKANMAAKAQDRLPEEELIGQMSLFIFAGHDTTASAICRILHLLSLDFDVQNKLREEVTNARQKRGDLDYDTLMNLPYLDAVCRETLRVFPPSTFRVRTTREDITMPLQTPIKSADGKTDISEIHVQKNTDVIISILEANLSRAIWGEDAEEWKPERWLEPMPDSVAAARLPSIYSSMMTFLGGGRACIGIKFAELELKIALSVLLEAFVFAPAKEIYWNMGRIQSPVIKGSGDNTPQLPLRVSLAQV